MEEDNVAIRLKFFIESLGITNSQFADTCGIPRPSLSQILTGRNKKVSDVIVGMIHKGYPQLSVIWLMFGEGEMLNPEDKPEQKEGENPSDPMSSPVFGANGEEIGLENMVNSLPGRVNAGISGVSKNQQAGLQKNKNASSPRKVTHITVYYDDSSYETFYPKK